MPDTRLHRGPHPEDARLFAVDAWPRLRAATADLCWLLDRGYAGPSSLKLVGDRHELAARQRTAVARAACSTAQRDDRLRRRLDPAGAAGGVLLIDGYNLLTTIEAALAGGVILHARDGCFRDMASMHGSYRKVRETAPALELIGGYVARLGVAACHWLLDSPVSNSGRLRSVMLALAAARGWAWQVELVTNPDPLLCQAQRPIVTSDSVVLDRAGSWLNLARPIVERHVPDAAIVDLSLGDGAC